MVADALKRFLSSRENVAFAGLVLAGLAFMGTRLAEFPVGAFVDDAYYIEMARSISEGRGPVIHCHPDIPPQYSYLFPAGYPLLLSPVAWLFPSSVSAYRSLSAAATLGMILVFGLLLRNVTAKRDRMVLAALVLLSPWTLAYSNRVLSDAPYAFLSYSALLVYVKWLEAERPGLFRSLLLIVMLGLCATVRSMGMSLLIAVIGHLVFTGRFRRALAVAPCVALTLMPQVLINLSAGGGLISQGYYDQATSSVSGLFDRALFVGLNLIGYVQEIPSLMLPIFGNPTHAVALRAGFGGLYPYILLSIGLALAALVVTGMVASAFRSGVVTQVFALYLLVYVFGLLNFSGYPSGARLDAGNYLRLLLPVLPLLYLFALQGMQAFFRTVQGTPARLQTLSLWMLLFILPMSLAHNVYRVAVPLRSAREPSGKGYFDGAIGSDWVRSHTTPTDVIMTRDPLQRHIHFNRPVIDFGPLHTTAMFQRIAEYGVQYIFVGPATDTNPRQIDAAGMQVLRLMSENPERFEMVYSDSVENIHFYRVRGYEAP